MPFVLDNSVVCGWLLENQASPYTEAVASQLGGDHAIAPALLHLEYTNVLRTACKRRRMIARQAQEAIAQLRQLPIETNRDPPDPAQLLALALQYGLTAYGATYLNWHCVCNCRSRRSMPRWPKPRVSRGLASCPREAPSACRAERAPIDA